MSEETNLNLDDRAVQFIKQNSIAQELLQHLHPSAETAIVVEDAAKINSNECPLAGIAYGARRIWLNPTRETREHVDIIEQLCRLSVLEAKNYENRTYYALPREWNCEKEQTIYSQLCVKSELRVKLHKQIGSQLPPLYLVDKA